MLRLKEKKKQKEESSDSAPAVDTYTDTNRKGPREIRIQKGEFIICFIIFFNIR